MASNTADFHQCETTLAVHVELRKLLICEYLDPNPLRDRFRLNCRTDLPPSMIQEQKIEKILDYLERNGIFSEGNYNFIKEKAADVDVDIIKMIQLAEARIKEIRANSLMVKTFVTEVDPIHLEKETREEVDRILLAVHEKILCRTEDDDEDASGLLKRYKQLDTLSDDFFNIWHKEFCRCRKQYGRRLLLQYVRQGARFLELGKNKFDRFRRNIVPKLLATLKKISTTTIHVFNNCGASLVSVVPSSVLSFWVFDSVINLDKLWRKYEKEGLHVNLQEIFNTNDVLSLLNVDKISLNITIEKSDYLKYRQILDLNSKEESRWYLSKCTSDPLPSSVAKLHNQYRNSINMVSVNIFTKCETEEEVHNALMTSFCCDFFDLETWKNKFQKFKLKSFLYLKSPVEKSSVSNAHDIWKELERMGLLGLSNYNILKKLVQDIDNQLVYLIEDAEDKLTMLKGEDVPTRKRQKTLNDEDTNVQIFRKKLIQINHNGTLKIPISPMQRTSRMAIGKIFAPVSVREELEYKEKGRNIGMQNKSTKPVNCIEDMLYIDGDMARNVFVLGEAGIGKTVFCLRLVDNWCKAHNSDESESNSADSNDRLVSWVYPLKNFDFLFSIQLRHVNKSRSSVIDMIIKDAFQSHPGNQDVIRRVLLSENYRCLIIIDGVDEWKIPDEIRSELKHDGLPNTENITNCTFIWSMRPRMMENFSKLIRGNDRVVEIQGLDINSINIVIEKLLVNFYELDEKSQRYEQKLKEIKQKSENSKLKSLMQIPLMTIACVQIWYEENDVGKSMTSLYVAILDLLIRRSNRKSPPSKDLTQKLAKDSLNVKNVPQILLQNLNIKEFMHVIINLGSMAHDHLLSNHTRLVFPKEDLDKNLEKYELDIALETGLLSTSKAPGSCNEENVSVNFFHKSMQEFLAAIYIENKGDIHKFIAHLSSVKVIMELSNVLIFLSGLNPMLGSSISKHIADVANTDTDICNFRIFSDVLLFNTSAKKIEHLYRLQANCYRELDCSYSNIDNKGKIIRYHVSDVNVDYDSDMETIKATVDILTHHYTDIKSLSISKIPNDVKNGIPDSLLTQFLCNTRSLQSLNIVEYNSNRTLYHIGNIFSSLSSLLLYDIILTPNALCSLQTALQSNTVIQTLGLIGIRCQISKDHTPTPALMSGIIYILPNLPRLCKLHIKITNKDDKPVFRDILSRLSHLHGMYYKGTIPRDDGYDRDVVRTLSMWSGLRLLYLYSVDLGDCGLQLSHNMLLMQNVFLSEVQMSSSGWRYFIQSVLNIQCTFNVDLYKVDIDEDSKTMIRSSPNLKIENDQVNDANNLRHDLYFKRMWPPTNAIKDVSQ